MGENERKRVRKEQLISKLKDDGDFDRLRLKIIRKLKDNEELRNNIISVIKESAALNRPGADNMKPRQLSDAIYEDVGEKVQGQISESLWAIIKSEDGMKSEIAETVECVYNKLVNPGGGEPSAGHVPLVDKEADNDFPVKALSGKIEDTVLDIDPKGPPGFSFSPNRNNNVNEAAEEHKEEPPSFSTKVEPCDDNDEEDPEVPPGFG